MYVGHMVIHSTPGSCTPADILHINDEISFLISRSFISRDIGSPDAVSYAPGTCNIILLIVFIKAFHGAVLAYGAGRCGLTAPHRTIMATTKTEPHRTVGF